MTIDEWISKFDNEECDKLSQMEQIEVRDMLIELKERREGYSNNSNTREDFMHIVYNELSDDSDNCRANRIIDAADAYADSFGERDEDG